MEENKKQVAVKVQIEKVKGVLAHEYMKQIQNYFGDQKQALKFLSGVVASIQRLPKLLECEPASLINSFMVMAQLGFMPSAVSGEAYVLPYNDKKSGMIAQFQIGYQGIVTLLYLAGAKSVVAELVLKNDKFTIINGKITHEIDPFKTKEERGDIMGAYAIIYLKTGGTVEGFMRKEEIMAHGKRFSKSFDTSFSPWKRDNDPEGWMLRKTVLKQVAKLAPKNEKLNFAIAEDNKDSDIADRLEEAKTQSSSMAMGALVAGETPKVEKNPKENANEKKADESEEEPIEDIAEDNAEYPDDGDEAQG